MDELHAMSNSKRIYSNKNGSKFVASKESRALAKIGRKSAKSAFSENVALGLPVSYINKGRIIKEMPDGRKEIIGRVKAKTHSSSVSKGDVIRVKKD